MTRSLITLLTLLALLAGCGSQDPPSITLALAVERGDLHQVKRHIESGTDINQTVKPGGQRPLHVAINQGDIIIVKLLAERGADINILNDKGESPLTRALINGRTQIADYLVKQGAKRDPDALLDQMILAGVTDRDTLRALVDWGANVNHQDSEGNTPLVKAIQRENRVLTKLLIASGADVNLKNQQGHYPLDFARQVGSQDIVQLLEKNGALGSQAN